MLDRERDCAAYRLPEPILQVAPAIGKLDGWAVKWGGMGWWFRGRGKGMWGRGG
jgi:hypothetical protein